uniref:Epsin 3 n=1 Tax=Amphilophus citrinellus TaxID=61819 RepID=A0A3Q0R3S8_AMPCI
MQTSSIRRQVKNMVNNYTEAEIKVREATSNDPWGPSSSLMAEIADLTFNVVAFTEVMGMIWKRLNDHGKNWRHVYKALTLLDYLIKTGSERVARDCRDNIYSIQTLRDFQYLDRDGRDQGVNVREKSKQLVALLRDEEKLKKERTQAMKTKTRMAGVTSSLGNGKLTCKNTSSSSPRLAPDLEQARPATSGEEELQLQLALAMSREESEKTSFMDLVDVFAVPTDLPPSDHRWNRAPHHAAAGAGAADTWDSLGEPRVSLVVVYSFLACFYPLQVLIHLLRHQKEQHLRELLRNLLPELVVPQVNDALPAIFPLVFVHRTHLECCLSTFLLTDGDPFDDAMDGGQVNGASGREGSPELFDLSRLRESLNDPRPRTCRTPESFLDPSAASLVNLDSLIPANPSAKTKNPFLSGLSAPSPTNPFQADQPKLSLNQMGSSSTLAAPHATSLPYSASLPLPTSHQGASIPLSHTHPTQPGLDLPVSLPEPLLPFSSASAQGSQAAQGSQNPFL